MKRQHQDGKQVHAYTYSTFGAGKIATVDSMAVPAQAVHGESHMQHQERGLHAGEGLSPNWPARSGILGSLSKAADLVLYVAGSPAAVERRARRIGHRTAAL